MEVSLLAAFVAGTISFLSPCVLPLVPGYISMLSGIGVEQLQQGVQPRTRLFASSLAFVSGFSVVFVTFGASASAVGQFLQRNRSLTTPFAGAVVILFGLHLIGWLARIPVRPGAIVGGVLATAGYVVVVSVLPGSPADKAGMRGGDVLEAVAGFTTREMSVAQAKVMLDGAPGSTVKLSVVRRGRQEPLMVDLTRAVLPAQHLTIEKMDDVAYVDVPALSAGMAAELHEKLQQFDRQGVHKLVLDLRDTASGPVAEGIAAARLFVPSGNITALSGQTMPRQAFDAEPAKVIWRYPVEVLISERTLGAAEVLAAALGGNQRAGLVGGRTFGGACEQKLIPLDDGSALILSVAYYYTPAGKSILDEGVQPTVAVRLPLEFNDDDDAVAPVPQPQRPAPANDPVLRKALDLLKEASTPKAA